MRYNLFTMVNAVFQAFLGSGTPYDYALEMCSALRETFVQGDEYIRVTLADRSKYLIRREDNEYSMFLITGQGLCPVDLGV